MTKHNLLNFALLPYLLSFTRLLNFIISTKMHFPKAMDLKNTYIPLNHENKIFSYFLHGYPPIFKLFKIYSCKINNAHSRVLGASGQNFIALGWQVFSVQMWIQIVTRFPIPTIGFPPDTTVHTNVKLRDQHISYLL